MLRGVRRAVRIDLDNRSQIAPRAGARPIALRAGRQHGGLARRELRALRVSEAAIDRRVAGGRLHVVHRGVYAVGHPVVGCAPRRSSPTTASPPQRRPARSWTWPQLCPAAHWSERSTRRRSSSSPTTPRSPPSPAPTPATTAPASSPERSPSTTPAPRSTRSQLEERFLALCRATGLPQPHVNAHAAGFEVDFLYTAHRLAVETDGWRYHRSHQAFERDRARDAALARAGYRTLRFTHREIDREPDEVAQTLAAALSDRRAA